MSTGRFDIGSREHRYPEITRILADSAGDTLDERFGKGKVEPILQHLDLVLRSHALTRFFGVEDPAFRQALNAQLHNPRTSTVVFIDVLGAHAWANPLFYRYAYEQATTYVSRNHGVRWNLNFKSTRFGDLLKNKVEGRLIEGDIDVDEVMPNYGSGDQINLQMVRILSWLDDDMMSDVAQHLIDLHRAFSIPLLFIPREQLGYPYHNKSIEFHLALDADGNVQQKPEGCWVYDEELTTGREGTTTMSRSRVPLSEYQGQIDPLGTIHYIPQQEGCVFAVERRKQLSGQLRKRKILFVNSPTRDVGGFKGSPTSLLYAIGPLVVEIKEENKREISLEGTDEEGLGICGFSHVNLVDPTFYDKPEQVTNGLLERLQRMKPVIVGISCTFDSFNVAVEIADHVRQQSDYDPIIILGGPHCDEVDFDVADNPNNPLQKTRSFDFVIAGDGEYMLLALVREIMKQLKEMPERGQGAQCPAPDFTELVRKGVLERAEVDRVFSSVKGIARVYFMVNGEQRRYESSGRKLNLDELPFLHYEYLKKDHLSDFDVFDKNGETAKCVQVMTHRGCKSGCRFCTEKVLVFDRKRAYYNSKGAQTVVDEIQHYVDKMGIERVFFDDSTFTVEKVFVKELCRKLDESGLSKKIEWGCLNTFDAVQDEDLLEEMWKAGLRYMYLGVEVLDNAALKEMKKPSSIASIDNTLQMLKSREVMVGVSVLLGYPKVSKEAEVSTIKQVGKWVGEGKIILVSLSLTNYHPASTLTDHLLDLEQTALDYTEREVIERQSRAPWNCFEEGGWYHPDDRAVNEEYLREMLWQVKRYIPLMRDGKRVIVRGQELQEYIDWLWSTKDGEILQARDYISAMNEVSLSKHCIVGEYVRHEESLCRRLREVVRRIQSGLSEGATTREHYLIWGPSRMGKTFLFEQIATSSRSRVVELNLMKDDEREFCGKVAELDDVIAPTLCLVDEVDTRPGESWPFRTLRPYFDKATTGDLPVTFVLVGSAQVESVNDFRNLLASATYPKGPDLVLTIPHENLVEIPSLTLEDRALIALSSVRQASLEKRKGVMKVEKAALFYVVLHPALDRPAMIARFVRRAVERLEQGDKLTLDDLFSDNDGEREEFLSDDNRRMAMQELSDECVVIKA